VPPLVGVAPRGPEQALGAGRPDPDAAARPPHFPVASQDTVPQDQRILRLLRDRAALLQGPDPDAVRQRDLPRARQLRLRGGVPLLLRQESERRDPGGGGAAGWNRPAPRGSIPVPESLARPPAEGPGVAPDAA